MGGCCCTLHACLGGKNLQEPVVKPFIVFIIFFLNFSFGEVIIFSLTCPLFLLKGNSVYALIGVLFFTSCDISPPTPSPRSLLNLEDPVETIILLL